MAQVEYFLKIDGVAGESLDAKHQGELQIDAWSYGATNASTAVGGGAGTGKVTFRDIRFTKETAPSSIALLVGCATGQHFKSATLTCRRGGAQGVEFMTILLSNVMVTSYEDAGFASAAQLPQDTFTLNYARIEVHARTQKPDGTLSPETVGGWDLAMNRRV